MADKAIEVNIKNPFISAVLDEFMKIYKIDNITPYVDYLARVRKVDTDMVLDYLSQETPPVDNELFEVLVAPIVVNEKDDVDQNKFSELLNLAIQNTVSIEETTEENEETEEKEEEKEEEATEGEEVEKVETPTAGVSFSKNTKESADFMRKIADLEQQLKERDRRESIRESLFELRNRASKDVEKGILPPYAFKILMGDFESPSDFFASFSRATEQNQCSEEEHLARIAYTLSVFEQCGGNLDFSYNLDEESDSRKYQDERLSYLENAESNLKAMGLKK